MASTLELDTRLDPRIKAAFVGIDETPYFSAVASEDLSIPPTSDTLVGIVSLAGLFEVGAVGEGVLLAGLDVISPFVDVSSLIP